MTFLFIIILAAIIYFASQSDSSSSNSGGPTVSTNSITYPADIHCECCNKSVKLSPRVIDSSTWDLKCPHCNEIAYKHPKREERKQQLDDLLNW